MLLSNFADFGIPPFPASSLTLEYFCVHASQHVSYKTLKVYLSGIRLAHIERGMADPAKSTSLHLGFIASRVITKEPDYP